MQDAPYAVDRPRRLSSLGMILLLLLVVYTVALISLDTLRPTALYQGAYGACEDLQCPGLSKERGSTLRDPEILTIGCVVYRPGASTDLEPDTGPLARASRASLCR